MMEETWAEEEDEVTSSTLSSLSTSSFTERLLETFCSEFVENILERALKYVQENYCPFCNIYIDKNFDGKCTKCKLLIDEFVWHTTVDAKKKLIAEDGRNYVFNQYDPPKDIDWFSNGEYSCSLASNKIKQYIQTWEFHSSWLYHIDFLTTEELEFDYLHKYRVRWSIPTRCQPIPRGTVCIYFTFQVSKIKPKDYPVKVSFVIETNQLVHRPGKTRFREKWLKDIIESKVKYNCLNL
ncbi:A-kinase anchor protein 14-like [Argonauta hians]